MIQLKDLGTFELVPHIMTDIVTGNIRALENALVMVGILVNLIELWYSEHTPLKLALGYVLLAKCSVVSREWR